MTLALPEQSYLVGAVDSLGDDLDGELSSGGATDAPPADAEAAVAEDSLSQVDLVLLEKSRVLEKEQEISFNHQKCCI